VSDRAESKALAISTELLPVGDKKPLYHATRVNGYSTPAIDWHLETRENAVRVLPVFRTVLLLPMVVPTHKCTDA
jgi:hypothetical protein